MKILEFKLYYEPEIAAGISLDSNTAEDLAKMGHFVHLFTPIPCRGISKTAAKSTPTEEFKIDNRLHITRYKMFRERKNLIARILRYIFCSFRQIRLGLKEKDVDLIFAGSTPPFQGLVCRYLKRKKKIPFVFNCQDIFPDSLVSTGISKKNSLAYKIGLKISNITFKAADCIIVPSEEMKKNLINKGVDESKVFVVSNWIDESIVFPIEINNNTLAKELSLDNRYFYVVYAGNIGYAQSVETIINAALLLKGNERIRFVIFGNGALEEKIKKLVFDNQLLNVSIYPLQEYKRVSEVYSLGDAYVVPCKKGTGISGMPSKTWNIMACSKPVLASFDEDTMMERIVENEKCGLFSKSEDATELANNILKLFNNQQLCNQLGKNGYEYVLNNLTRNVCTSKIERIIKDTYNGFQKKCV